MTANHRQSPRLEVGQGSDVARRGRVDDTATSLRAPRWAPLAGVAALALGACNLSSGAVEHRVVEIDPYTTTITDDAGLGPGQVALTFDDGPAPDTTLALLDVLDAHGVQATFFLVGVLAETYPELVAEILSRGHTLGTHTYSHVDLTTLSLSDAVAELDRGDAAVTAAANGTRPSFFRFPEFSFNAELVDAANDRGRRARQHPQRGLADIGSTGGPRAYAGVPRC